MKMQHFVSGSAVMIVCWLMVTFFHAVSPLQYPKQRRNTPAHTANREPVKALPLSQNSGIEKPGKLAASLPH